MTLRTVVSRFGLAHLVIGMTILFGTLHPIRDMMDDHSFELCRSMSIIQTLNGLGMMVLQQQHSAMTRPALLIGAGTALSAAMAYWIAFTGTHPLDYAVPVGGAAMLAGWVWALVHR